MAHNTRTTRWLTACCIAGLLAACSDDDADSGTSVQVDAATQQSALTELSGAVDTTVTSYKGGAGDGAIVLDCAAGGQASVDGHVSVVAVPVSVDVNVGIEYKGCTTASGTSIAGSIDFSQKVAAGPGQPLRVETTYVGDVTFSGKIQARCPIDMNVLVDETGRAVQVAGQFCGRDAAGLNIQIMPRWGGAAQGSATAGASTPSGP